MRFDALKRSDRTASKNYDLYAKTPDEITENLVVGIYGEKGEEFI
jgi:hypothetical protein